MMKYPRKLIARLARFWVRNRDIKIIKGEGAGLRFNTGQASPAFAFGTNEQPVQAALAQHVKSGDVVYDIGANVGFFSVIAARLVGEQGAVYAFEPLPANAAQLRHNIDLNGFEQVHIFEYAVSNQSGQGELLIAANVGGSALSTADPPPDQTGIMPVEVVAIDDLIPAQVLRPPSAVKIDVEGAELDVLQGMRHTIEAHRPVIIYEVDAATQEYLQEKQSAIYDFLTETGYNLSELPASYGNSAWHVLHVIAIPSS